MNSRKEDRVTVRRFGHSLWSANQLLVQEVNTNKRKSITRYRNQSWLLIYFDDDRKVIDYCPTLTDRANRALNIGQL